MSDSPPTLRQRGLVLAIYLEPEHEVELAHALTHVSEEELRAALAEGWPAPWE